MAGPGTFNRADGPQKRSRPFEPFGSGAPSKPSSPDASSLGAARPSYRSAAAQPPLRRQETPAWPESLPSTHKLQFVHEASEPPKRVRATPLGPNISPPRPGSRPKSPVNDAKSPSPQRSSPIVSYADIYDAETVPAKPSYSNVPKRSRSPPFPSSDVSLATSFVQISSEREMQAKAKRLARFNVELNQSVPKLQDIPRLKSIGNKLNGALTDKGDTGMHAEEGQDLGYCGSESADVIVGLCPDMCPESEREERERKGDLDKHERLDGERNQTSKFLAVKKYNRTAERDADLIRPMPVLQKTIDYLLDLLDQPYSDNFLRIYNFLWDRMRAIRMDLRMQHIFNQHAITMLEQMIRLHIIAMHELCEYKKGEGFSEGFDAHLNIEQMNKTSVELFQMYDDHRKKGQYLPTEKEFRGYYALLKLDRHPGYKVEPAELSLDLAKMAPEIRCSPDILFARDVARSCRMGNYISFFRLASKATYLQACLMHAHFSKMRTQALASLHSGLQNNQGIPVQHVLRWLGMEGEDVESFLEYHGFMLRNYEELYMVKEGPLLNRDTDFPTKRSQLVNLKKSKRIMDDAYSAQAVSFVQKEKDIVSEKINITDQGLADSSIEAWDKTTDGDLLENIDSDPRGVLQPLLRESSPAASYGDDGDEMTEVSPSGVAYVHVDNSVSEDAQQAEDEQIVESDQIISKEEMPSPKMNASLVQAGTYRRSNSQRIDNSVPPSAPCISFQNEMSGLVCYQKDELSREKLKQILRKWNQRTSMLRKMRLQKQLLATAAINSISLGPPIQQFNTQLSLISGDLDIGYVARERHGRQEKSWSRLNVSEVVSPILFARNPGSKCICWKLVIYAQANDAQSQSYHLALRWLQSKLMGIGRENDDEIIVSLPQLAIWKKWSEARPSPHRILSLAIIKEVIFAKNQPISEDYNPAGASCIMFVVSESIPWEMQRARLWKILMSIPPGSSLPLLIISSDAPHKDIAESWSSITELLGLHFVDKMRIDSFRVVFLAGSFVKEHFNGFYDDDHLRESLQWLASHSPHQLDLCVVKTCDLILSYLRRSLVVLDNLDASEVGPNHCISAFNEALDKSAEDILAAASRNSINWPGFEIGLLENSSNEQLFAKMFLPSVGWSSAARVEPVIRAMKACKLPNYPDNLSWLRHGSHVVAHIQNQKLALEKSLTSYLTQTSELFSLDLAMREANVTLQKGARLELSGSSYHIVPRWVVIFRRIYNWQLMKLYGDEFSKAYILESLDGFHDRDSAIENHAGGSLWSSDCLKDMGSARSEKHLAQNPFLAEPSLDEMLEVISNGPALQKFLLARWPVYSSPRIENHEGGHAFEISNGSKLYDEQHSNGYKADSEQHRFFPPAVDFSMSKEKNKEIAMPLPPKTEKLSTLLEQCNQLQDMIDEKLAIYF